MNEIICETLEEFSAIPYKNGKYILNECQEIYYYLNNLLHREDGPAVESNYTSSKEWYIHGKLHRIDGPAIVRIDYIEDAINGKYSCAEIITNSWYYNGVHIPCRSQNEFEKLIEVAQKYFLILKKNFINEK